MNPIQTTTDDNLLFEILMQDLSPEVTEMYDRFVAVLVAIDVMRESASPESMVEALEACEIESGDASKQGDLNEVARLDRAIRYLKDECCVPARP